MWHKPPPEAPCNGYVDTCRSPRHLLDLTLVAPHPRRYAPCPLLHSRRGGTTSAALWWVRSVAGEGPESSFQYKRVVAPTGIQLRSSRRRQRLARKWAWQCIYREATRVPPRPLSDETTLAPKPYHSYRTAWTPSVQLRTHSL